MEKHWSEQQGTLLTAQLSYGMALEAYPMGPMHVDKGRAEMDPTGNFIVFGFFF